MATIEGGPKAIWLSKLAQSTWTIMAKAHDDAFGPHIEFHNLDGSIFYLMLTLDEVIELHRWCGVTMGEEDAPT